MRLKLSVPLIVAALGLACGSPDATTRGAEEPTAAQQGPSEAGQEILSGDFESGTTEEWAGAADDQEGTPSDPESEGPGGSN